jgi:hypothetical protein
MNGYLVACTAFHPDDFPGGQSNFDLRNPLFQWKNAGLPCVDLSPDFDSQPHFGACVFVQEVGEDGYGPIVNSYEVDTFDQDRFTLISQPIMGQTPLDSGADGLYPSIMVSYDPIVPRNQASITYMAQEPQNDVLRARFIRIPINPSGYTNSPVLWQNWPFGDASLITGNYNLSQISYTEPGVSTGVIASMGSNDWYWAAWSDRIEMEAPPQNILATWGSTSY